jgi:DNA-binding NarL/FixJ family response regulator
MPTETRIVIVDDHPVVLEGLSNMLHRLDSVTLVAGCADAIAAMAVLRKEPVDLVITDINLPEISGIELCRRIRSAFPHTRVIGISTFHDPAYARALIDSGGSCFVTKNAAVSEFETAIRKALEGETWVADLLTEQKPLSFSQEQGPVITRREREVLSLIASGLTNKQIAEKLFVSIATVDSHRKNLLSKFGVLNTAALVASAAKSGLIS